MDKKSVLKNAIINSLTIINNFMEDTHKLQIIQMDLKNESVVGTITQRYVGKDPVVTVVDGKGIFVDFR